MSESFAQLDALFAALRDDAMTESQRVELDALVASDPAALDRFIHLRLIESGLTERFGEPRTIPFASADASGRGAASPAGHADRVVARPELRVPRFAYALAAALLLAAAAVAIYVFAVSNPQTAIPDPQSPAPIAVLTDATDVVWSSEPLSPGAELTPRTLRIDSGTIELSLLGGATVHVTGPAEVDLNGRTVATLRLGRLHARVARGGGFVVDMPNGVRVTDLSTEFAVSVDADGATSVGVIDGRVVLTAGGGDAELGEGEARRVDASGVVSVIDAAAMSVVGIEPSTLPVPDAYTDLIRSLDPIAWYRFDAAHDGVIDDATGHGHAAHLIDSATIARDGDGGSLLLPIGGFGHAVVNAAPALDTPGKRVTVAAWVNLVDRPNQAIVHKWSDGFGYSLEVFEGKPGFVVAFDNDYGKVVHVKTDQLMPVNRWVQLVGVYDGQTVAIWVDGQLAAAMAVPTIDAPVNASTGPMVIGRRSEKREGFTHGMVDEVAIFDAALTPAQVADLYRAMLQE